MQACKGAACTVQNRSKLTEVEYGFSPTPGQGNDLHARREKGPLPPRERAFLHGKTGRFSLLLQRFNRGQIVSPKELLVEPQTAARMGPRQ